MQQPMQQQQPQFGYGGGQQQVVVVQQPGAAAGLRGQNQREWSSGLCGCFEDCSSCCYAYWCYPCFMCTLATELDECACGPCCCHGLNPCISPMCFVGWCNPASIFVVPMRTKVRTMYGVKGSICKDICCAYWCHFCIATQMHRELKHQKDLMN